MAENSGHFYDGLPAMRTPDRVFDAACYVQAPADWLLAVSDIRSSTAAVEAGRHSDVNFAAAAMIASLTNICGTIPYQFGGDGAVVLIPPAYAAKARRALAQTRTFAEKEFGLTLRVGAVPVSEMIARAAAVLVGRYEPSPGNAYAVFLGNGIELLELAVKERGEEALRKAADIGTNEDDGNPPDLTGLSCRWTPLQSARGKMVSLVVRGADHGALHQELTKVAGVEALNAASLANLNVRWPPKGMVREARARRGTAGLFGTLLQVIYDTFIGFLCFRFKISVGNFDPERYRREVTENAVNFARSGENLCLVFDCPENRIEALKKYLDDRAARGELRYGMHVSDHAVMTCLVASYTDNNHVHFVDGGDGGYTRAATQLKAQSRNS